LGPLGTAATYRPIVPAPGDYDDEIGGMMIGRGNRSTRRKPATLSTTKPTCSARKRTPGRRGGKPATNRLSYGTAFNSLKVNRRFGGKYRLDLQGRRISRARNLGLTLQIQAGTRVFVLLHSDSPPASAEVKKMWIYTSTPPYASMAQCLIS
jgi:hypothetical protein